MFDAIGRSAIRVFRFKEQAGRQKDWRQKDEIRALIF
jgi:hypothetical protein